MNTSDLNTLEETFEVNEEKVGKDTTKSDVKSQKTLRKSAITFGKGYFNEVSTIDPKSNNPKVYVKVNFFQGYNKDGTENWAYCSLYVIDRYKEFFLSLHKTQTKDVDNHYHHMLSNKYMKLEITALVISAYNKDDDGSIILSGNGMLTGLTI